MGCNQISKLDSTHVAVLSLADVQTQLNNTLLCTSPTQHSVPLLLLSASGSQCCHGLEWSDAGGQGAEG